MNRLGLYCSRCSAKLPFRYLDMKCDCGGTLLVDYDWERIRRTLTKEVIQTRYPSMWRYKDLLPVSNPDCITTLGEGWTPLLRLKAWEQKLPIRQLWLKREEQNPTGSFKSRGFSVAVSLLKELGATKAAVPSNGNAAGALAAYAACAGIAASVFIPLDCPPLIVDECPLYGAATYLVDGFIHDAAAIIEDGKQEQGWVNVGTLKEPGRVEGKKTMGLELAEQLNWTFPDVIIYPTGGGSGIIGMWKAYHELKAMGWIDGPLPRFVCVQEEGCQPIVDGLIVFGQAVGSGGAKETTTSEQVSGDSGQVNGDSGQRSEPMTTASEITTNVRAGGVSGQICEPMTTASAGGVSGQRSEPMTSEQASEITTNVRAGGVSGQICEPMTTASEGAVNEQMGRELAGARAAEVRADGASPTGMRVPKPPDVELILSIIVESGGTAIALSKSQIADATRTLGSQGISSSPEGSATWAGLLALCDNGWLRPSDSVVLFNTSHAMKYTQLAHSSQLPIIRSYEDYRKHHLLP
ncbi:threonine synthase [Paenibacillus sp. HWE-109]|uniref:threonine synthase n=1 Tax=Paenibacillus sp. HWE-109 TaxID=1306526 RepID=UPI001EE050A7|nr:threonine synthase [Paenibacillus sp. HWE-109]UKS30784.1 threonine synthase [Paenibacillus sp. HWE-109]